VPPITMLYDLQFAVGLTIVTAGAAGQDLTVTWD